MTAFALILAALAAALSLPNLGRATIPVGTALAMLNLTLLPDIALRLAALSGMPTFLSTGDPIVVGCLMYAGLILLLTGAFADLCSLRRRAHVSATKGAEIGAHTPRRSGPSRAPRPTKHRAHRSRTIPNVCKIETVRVVIPDDIRG